MLRPLMRKRLMLPPTLLLALAALPALASDGVLEINQACAVNTGCFAGDSAGFPVTIATAGSYRLTGNLSSSTTAISASVPGVRIDLGGFSIVGPGSCSASFSGDLLDSVSCSGNAGVGVSGAEEVRRGDIRGFVNGISGTSDRTLRLVDVFVSENSFDGVSGQGDVVVTDSTFAVNGQRGVDGQTDQVRFVVRNSIFRQNGAYGLYLGAGVVQGSFFLQNGLQGIRSQIAGGGIVSDSVFQYNGTGINASPFVGIRSCSFRGNTTHIAGGTSDLGQNLCEGGACP